RWPGCRGVPPHPRASNSRDVHSIACTCTRAYAPLSWVFRTIALAPTFVVLGVALGVFIGGGILRRLKRGRPDTWLYRQLQWRIATRHPLMAGWVGGHVLISRSGFWTTRRSAR
ncbi:TIGR03750 family conjugal transfer protein, partial [Pseudomonas fulva]|uniref:TIGR03750 family conjugal transfer protein n=1 Tax=Pseudomonas fulva TaxID=47880 RepID=UPI003D04097B